MSVIEFFTKDGFTKRTKIFAFISLFINLFLGIGKFVGAFLFHNYFLFAAALFNIFILLSKGECLLGLVSKRRSFKIRNFLIFIFVLTAGIIYLVYSLRLVIHEDYKTYKFTTDLAVLIVIVSFVELIVATVGLFRVTKYGHFYRDIKIINFISALTAIVLGEAAFASFATGTRITQLNNGIFGMIVGIITIILSIYIFFAPVLSIIDREHNVYKMIDKDKAKIYFNESNILELPLSFSTIFRRYIFIAYLKDGIVDGHIQLTKNIYQRANPYVKIILIIFLPIYILPIIILRIVYLFRTINIPKKLDKTMVAHGFIKINENNS